MLWTPKGLLLSKPVNITNEVSTTQYLEFNPQTREGIAQYNAQLLGTLLQISIRHPGFHV